MSFGTNLRTIRKERGFTQEQLAEKLNVSRQAISKWESGSGYPETEKLIGISKVLEVSLDYLADNHPADSSEIKETAAASPVENRILITAFDGSRTVNCLSVKYEKIMFPAKNEPEYILSGVDRVGFFGEHSIILAWYDNEDAAKQEMIGITEAINKGERTYNLRYFTDVRFTVFGTTERK